MPGFEPKRDYQITWQGKYIPTTDSGTTKIKVENNTI
jgi:hypothetical protein